METVTNDEAFAWARRLASEEGIFGGISTGANVAAGDLRFDWEPGQSLEIEPRRQP